MLDPELALNRFIVMRGNHVKSNGGIVVRGSSANVLVERNTVKTRLAHHKKSNSRIPLEFRKLFE